MLEYTANGCFIVLASLNVSRLNNIQLIRLSFICCNYEIKLYLKKMIINSHQNIISPDAVNTVGDAVDTLTGLLIDSICNFNITKII